MVELNLDEIRAKVAPCGTCDYGEQMGCTCSEGDPRPVIYDLCDEVERLDICLRRMTALCEVNGLLAKQKSRRFREEEDRADRYRLAWLSARRRAWSHVDGEGGA